MGFLNQQAKAAGFAQSLERLDEEVISRLNLDPYDELDQVAGKQQASLAGAEEDRDDFYSAVSILSAELALQAAGMSRRDLQQVLATDDQIAIEFEREYGYQRSNASGRNAIVLAAKKAAGPPIL